MKICLTSMQVQRDTWTLSANGTFHEGTHLVNGRVGSGKSTLAMVMAGLLSPSSGTVKYESISSCMLSLQFPEYHITGTTLTEECVSWGLDASPILDAEGFGEDGECDPFSLSRGELKRLHLACVLGKQHNLLLLDEPFSALDCEQKERLSRRLSERTTGITIIFTHERGILPRIDRYWEIRDGHLLDLGTFCPDFFRIEYPEQKRKNPER